MLTVEELLREDRIWDARHGLPLHSHSDNQHLDLSYTLRLLLLNGYDITPLKDRYLEFLHKCESGAFLFRRSPTSWNDVSHDEILGMISNSVLFGLELHKYILKEMREHWYFYNPTNGGKPRAFMARFPYLMGALVTAAGEEPCKFLIFLYSLQVNQRANSDDPGVGHHLLQWQTNFHTDKNTKLRESNDYWRHECIHKNITLAYAMNVYYPQDRIMSVLARQTAF